MARRAWSCVVSPVMVKGSRGRFASAAPGALGMQNRSDIQRAKARVYYKARRRGLFFRSCPNSENGVPRYRVIREDGFEVWWADHIGDAEAYLDKAAPKMWTD